MKKYNRVSETSLFATVGFVWILWFIVSALIGLASSGLVIYILYRVATHPW